MEALAGLAAVGDGLAGGTGPEGEGWGCGEEAEVAGCEHAGAVGEGEEGVGEGGY